MKNMRFLLKRPLIKVNLRYFYTAPSNRTFQLPFKYNTEEEEKILNTLNYSPQNTLLGLKLPKNKIKNLEIYKNRKGPFQTVNDLLEVDGFSVKTVKQICDRIITNHIENVNEEGTINNKKIRQLLTPPLYAESKITSSIGVHLESTGISWAEYLNNDDYIKNWGYEDFGTLPTKLLPHETFTLAYNISKRLPIGDVYIFEGNTGIRVTQNQPSAVTSYNQQLELTSMLLALININPLMNNTNDKTNVIRNKVHFLRPNLSARLFKTLVGNEKVSTSSVVSKIINNEIDESIPCSPIGFDSKLTTDYLAQSPSHKELLGQVLLLLITFKEICIVKNPICLKAITQRRNK